MNSGSRFHPLILIVFSALLLGAVLGLSILILSIAPKNNPPAPLPVVTSTVPAPMARPTTPVGWLTYTDKDAGFSFSYPPDAYLETGSNTQHPFNFIRMVFKDASQSSVIVDIRSNTAKSTPRELAAKTYQESGGQAAPKAMLDAEEEIMVGGNSASKYVIPSTLTYFMLFISCGDKMVVIYPGRNDDPLDGKTPGMDLFNTVLDTFHFPTQ